MAELIVGAKNSNLDEVLQFLDTELEKVKSLNELCFIETMCSIGAREDLGRPTTTALENKENFMEFLKQ